MMKERTVPSSRFKDFIFEQRV